MCVSASKHFLHQSRAFLQATYPYISPAGLCFWQKGLPANKQICSCGVGHPAIKFVSVNLVSGMGMANEA